MNLDSVLGTLGSFQAYNVIPGIMRIGQKSNFSTSTSKYVSKMKKMNKVECAEYSNLWLETYSTLGKYAQAFLIKKISGGGMPSICEADPRRKVQEDEKREPRRFHDENRPWVPQGGRCHGV